MTGSLRSTYIGFATHYKLAHIRRELASHIAMSWIAAYPPVGADGVALDLEARRALNELADCLGLDHSRADRTDLKQRDYEGFIEIDHKVERLFGLIGRRDEPVSAELFETVKGNITDSIVSVSEVALHAALATGAERIVYHGEQASHIPAFFSAEKGERILGDRFTCVDAELRDRCRSEIQELFPEALALTRDPQHPLAREVLYMLLTLIDILVATRIDARLLLIDAHLTFTSAERILPASRLMSYFGLRDAYERRNGAIAMTLDQGVVHGWNAKDMLNSAQYTQYCQAHGYANRLSAGSAAFGRLAHAVDALKAAYIGVEKSNIGFVAVKSIEKTLKCIVGSRWGDVRELASILDKLLKEREQDLTVYDGSNLNAYCELLCDRRIFGNLKRPAKRRWSERLGIHRLASPKMD